MKKKGFTLVELLAVIVILAIIALIATPMIMDVIEKSRKGAAIESVNGILAAADKYVMEQALEQKEYETTIDLTGDILTYKGNKPESGMLVIDETKRIRVVAKYGIYCIKKDYDDLSPSVVDWSPCEFPKPKTYGIKRSLKATTSTWERTEDSIGLVANAQIGKKKVKNDFDTIYPWSDIISYNYNIETKQVTAYYGDDDFRFDGSNGEVLTYIPAFYYRRYQDEKNEYIMISKEKQDGYIKSEAFSVGRYTMSGDATRVYSRSGYLPLTNVNITNFRKYAKNLGEEFGQLDYHYFILQLLYLVEYADFDSQTKLGSGYTYWGNSSPNTSGGCDILGMKSGYNNSYNIDGYNSVIYRGIEDIFGNVWQFLDGINVKDGQSYICYDKNQYLSNKFDDCYQNIGYVNNAKEGYPSKLGFDFMNPLIALPVEGGGYDSKGIPDVYSGYKSGADSIVVVGGYYKSSAEGGMWAMSMNSTSSTRGSANGARLIRLGNIS